jgi:hypothetical protein
MRQGQHAINRPTWNQSRRLRKQLIAFGQSLPVVDILAQGLHARRDQRVTLDDGDTFERSPVTVV